MLLNYHFIAATTTSTYGPEKLKQFFYIFSSVLSFCHDLRQTSNQV